MLIMKFISGLRFILEPVEVKRLLELVLNYSRNETSRMCDLLQKLSLRILTIVPPVLE